MSNEKHLHGDTGELSKFEVLLTYARSATLISELSNLTPDRLSRHCSGGLSAITKQLEELVDQESAYKLKFRHMISKRHIYDAAIEQRRTEEDEKYRAILAKREREEEQKRQIRTD